MRKSFEAIVPFDSLDDAERIRERAKKPGVPVVYGPGYLAIEACRALKGRELVWIKPDLPRFGYPIAGELEASILDGVRNRGVVIKGGAEIADVRENGGSDCVVRTTAGEQFRCPLLVVATERVPSVGFLAGSGVKVSTGVLVDDYLRTNVHGIYAAGDCAEVIDKAGGETRINFGWRSAIRQGELAGENMAGGGKVYIRRHEDFFWLLFGPSLLDRPR